MTEQRPGILIVDKPKGMTSHDVVNRVRRCLGTRRVGHAGTLDPDATGVLVMGVGEGTRLLEYLSSDNKTYAGTVVFGIGTDTDDASGSIQETQDTTHLIEADVLCSGNGFVGTYLQEVPLYSAVHIDGQRAYELARKGNFQGELPVREVHIHSLVVTDFRPGLHAEADFEVTCSKGTYIRAICRDWGRRLNVPAHMGTLRRLAAGSFALDRAIWLDDLLADEQPWRWVLPLEDALSDFPKLTVPVDAALRMANGQSVPSPDGVEDGVYAVFTEDGAFWMMSECVSADGSSHLRPRKVFKRV